MCTIICFLLFLRQSNILKIKPWRLTFEHRMKKKADRAAMKKYEKQIKADRVDRLAVSALFSLFCLSIFIYNYSETYTYTMYTIFYYQ